jgi:asparagine synthase (glutamine-hydrolysing)
LIYESGSCRIERYWQLSDNRYPELRSLPYPEQVAMIRAALTESVRLQMISDVPVGAFLSGGVDSSVLVALMARQTSQRIRTCSVGFGQEGAGIDETDDAQRIADFIGTDHSRIVVTGQDVADNILDIARALDQPSVDGVNSWFVSRAARHGVTVALSGTGGDESFGGYPWFITMVLAAQRFKHPSLRQFAGRFLQSSAFNGLARTRLLAGRLELYRGEGSFLARYARTYNIFGSSGAARMLSHEMRRAGSCNREMALDLLNTDELADAQPLERVSALCMRGYLQNQLLRDIDAVSMSQSLEVRVPYLDVPLIDLALSLPQTSKLSDLSGVSRPESASYRDTGTKKILVDIGRVLLPPGMDEQPKRGFAMPFGVWMKGELRDILEDTLAPRSVQERGLFNASEITKLRNNFHAGRADWPQPWLIMMTELWCREVFKTVKA